MRKWIKRFLGDRGYRLKDASRFFIMMELLYAKTPRFKFVQIGANDGVDALREFVGIYNCSGLVIEPLPDLFETLRRVYLPFPNVVPVNVALHATEPTATLYRIDPAKLAELNLPWVAGLGSFSPEHARRLSIPPEAVVKEQVACAHLMDILVRYQALDAHVLQIDTEGYDAEIIKMIDFARFRPVLIRYENIHISAQEKAEVAQILDQAGYRLSGDGADTNAELRC
jgi:FkbM family methyltransferase